MQGCYGQTDELFKLAADAPESEKYKQLAAAHAERVKSYIGWLTGLKINGMDPHTKIWGGMWTECYPDAIRKLTKEINDYAHARGIMTFYYDTTQLIPEEQSQKYFKDKWFEGVKLNSASGRNKYLCWSRDDLARRKAAGIGKYMREAEVDMVLLHGTDAGHYTDPEVWSQRCEKCHEKWGDDFTSASARLYNVFFEEIRKECPGANVCATQYPYSIQILSSLAPEKDAGPAFEIFRKDTQKYAGCKEKTVKYWRGSLKKLIPGCSSP